MSHSIALIHRRVPHGSASARESLDALLALSAYTEHLAVFFMGDGVYQLLEGQQPQLILGRHIAPTFKLLDLYDIDRIFVCEASLQQRGLAEQALLLNPERLSLAQMRSRLAEYDRFINL